MCVCVCVTHSNAHRTAHPSMFSFSFLLQRRRRKGCRNLWKAIHTFPKLDIKCNGPFYDLMAISISKYDFFSPLGPVLHTHYSHLPPSRKLNPKNSTVVFIGLFRPLLTSCFILCIHVCTWTHVQSQRQSQGCGVSIWLVV